LPATWRERLLRFLRPLPIAWAAAAAPSRAFEPHARKVRGHWRLLAHARANLEEPPHVALLFLFAARRRTLLPTTRTAVLAAPPCQPRPD
jgi:hypothetical protein